MTLIKSFCGGSRGAVFSKSAPLAAGGKEKKPTNNLEKPNIPDVCYAPGIPCITILELCNNEKDHYPCWSPDGMQIAFTSYRDGNGEIYVMDTDGSNQVRLTNTTATNYHASWSPNGTQIAFASDRDGNFEIYIMNADGSGQQRLTNNGIRDVWPSWSPDGTQVAFGSELTGDIDIYIINVDGTNLRRLTTSPHRDWGPAWRPIITEQ